MLIVDDYLCFKVNIINFLNYVYKKEWVYIKLEGKLDLSDSIFVV